MTSPLRTLPLDPADRHLVVGDVHGRHETLLALLEEARYDPAADVLYSVGDLIDRGPDAVAVVDFFDHPRRHAVRGNHEQMVVNPRRWRDVWLDPQHGGPTTLLALERHGRELGWLEAFCRELPIVLDVGDDDRPGAFRLVHAESPFDWSEADLRGFLDDVSSLEAGESRLLWGRDDVGRSLLFPGAAVVDPGRSPRRVLCGHTPLDAVLTVAGTSWIDTAAGGFLSCVDAVTGREWRAPFAAGDAGFRY